MDKMDPYVTLTLGPEGGKMRTTTKDNAGAAVEWDEIMKVEYTAKTVLASGRMGQTPVLTVSSRQHPMSFASHLITVYGGGRRRALKHIYWRVNSCPGWLSTVSRGGVRGRVQTQTTWSQC